MDDSSGECSGAIDDAFLRIENILIRKQVSNDLIERIFNWLYEQVQNSNYRNYGLDDRLEPLFFETAVSLKQMDKAYKFIDSKIDESDKEDTWSKNYYLQNYLGQKINLLQSEGRKAEADHIIDSYLHFETFRQTRVKQALSINNFGKAEKLILEGIKIAQEDNADGIVHQWKDQLLELYKQNNQSSKYNILARELFIENTSDIKYFRLYKRTSAKEDWQKNRDKLIAELKLKKQDYYSGVSTDDLAKIYIEEQMIDELFTIVCSSNSIHTIIRYTNHLKTKYPAELLDYYKSAIEIQACQTGRNIYVQLVEYLRQMAKLKGGLSAAKALKNLLLNKYKNRRAMKEEFEKLNWN
jgi:hypothetical protein